LMLSTVPKQATILREQGIAGVFVCGTTGEGHAMTCQERQLLAASWVDYCDNAMPLLVHVGTNVLPDARALAAHAESLGACAIASNAPSYDRPVSIESLVAYLREVAAAAPNTPFYYYDIPALTGVSFPILDVVKEAAACIDTFRGVKFTATDDAGQGACVGWNNSAYEILHGCDERMLSGLELGCIGAVGSTYNYAAAIYDDVRAAYASGDIEAAQRGQAESVRLVDVLIRFGVLRAGKAIMGMLGADCGPPRLPVMALKPSELAELREAIDGFDCFSGRFSAR
jgi:N-acetylneuraminate lyase